MADGDGNAISEETKIMLEGQVKKGKARKFILICKGAAIQTLIVFKKGPFGPKIMQAKKEGFKGTAYCGTIVGKGVSLTMQLAGNSAVADAMKTEGSITDKDPCKIAKLRGFFAEEGGLKFKPEFEIVTEPVKVSNVDDEEENTAPAPTESSEPTPEPAPEVDDAKLFMQRLKQMLPDIKQVQTDQGPQAAELKTLTASAQAFAGQKQFASGLQVLEQIEALLRKVDTGGQAVDPAQFMTRLKTLLPDIKRAQESGGRAASEIKALVGLAKAAAKSKEFTEGSLVLDELEQALKQVLAEESPAGPTSADLVQRLKGLLPKLKSAVSDGNPLADAMRALATTAQAALKEADLAAAEQAIDELQAMFETEPPKQDTGDQFGIPKGLVQKRGFLATRWQKIPAELSAEIKKLKSPMLATAPQEGPEKLIVSIQSALDEFCGDMQDALDDAINSGDATYSKSISLISEFKKRVQTDRLIQHIKANPYDNSVDVEPVLMGALDEIHQALQA